jgi:amino acid adenylation domain-containing protein/non-ribosomal peptide synthase protein (TIGR01720 family)
MSKESALKRWLNRKKKADSPTSSTPSVPASAPERAPLEQPEGSSKWYPLSPGQQRLWLLQEMNPGNPFYHYAETYRLKGHLDIDKLQEAYRGVVARHDILRTTVWAVDGVARQQVHTNPSFEFYFQDLSKLTSEAREAAAKEHCLKVANAPFNLQKGPLSRLLLIRLDEDSHLLLIAMHHIITDKWSMRVLREELARMYKGEPLVDSGLQYPNYCEGLQNISTPIGGLTYWKDKLSNLPVLLELPTDRSRPDAPSYQGGYRKTKLSPELTTALKDSAKDNNVTLFVYLLAAYSTLLHQYSGEDQFAVGTPVSNRNEKQLEKTIGFFNETIALKANLEGNPSFKSLVQDTRKTVLEAFSHLDVPFEDIVQEVNPERVLGVNPLFQTMFILHVEPEAASFGADLQLKPVPMDTGVTKFDLTLYIADQGEQLSVTFDYAADLFETDTIDRMQGCFQQLLTEVVARPERAVKEIDAVPFAEKQTLLAEWNSTNLPLPVDSRIHDIISDAARSTPSAVAVAYAGKQLTYEELEDRASILSKRLMCLGIGPGKMVGLYVGPCLELVVGILAILKAGGAYLPLDPEYPEERIRYLLEDAGADLMLTTSGQAENLSNNYQGKLLLLDDMEEQGEAAGTAEVLQEAAPDDLAYMIYTSGSTGRPKGVMVSHANLVHSTLARHHYYPTTPTAFLLLSSFSFDSSVAGIFWALTTGAKLVLAPRRIEQDLEALADLIADEGVSHTLMLPTLYDTVLRFTDRKRLDCLDTVIVAGEACSAALTQLHHSTLSSVRLFNEYGPTEATVWCTAYEVSVAVEERSVPIGRPIPNATAYVLSGSGSLCPIGVTGELFIGGKGVAKGYWQRPELTKARFLPNPFRGGEEMYRTGDRARWLANGNLEFLGRADRQVKLRGYRIELGEIKEAMLRYPGITRSIVKVDEGQQRLVAYYTGDKSIDANHLRDDLKARLPKHMVPTYFMALDDFPRLANGKIDQAGLPAPVKALSRTKPSGQPTETSAAEATLLRIWQETLSMEDIGIYDNFFEVGGDSILSIQIVARARKAGLQLSPRAIFEHQTIAELALFTKDKPRPEAAAVVYGDFPLLPIQQWFFAEHKVAPNHWNQAALFEVPASINAEAISQLISVLETTHAGLRQRFSRREDGSWRASLSEKTKEHTTEMVPTEALGGNHGRSAIETYLTGLQTDYPLTDTPLLRTYLFPSAGEDPARLILLAHHLIIDVVSWRILADDLRQLLRQAEEGLEPHLAPATAPYSNWSRSLQQMTQTGQFSSDLAFWQAQHPVPLAGVESLEAPATEATTAGFSASLSVEETVPLLQGAHRSFNTTTQDLLLAALLQTIEGDELHLSLEHNGREAAGGTTDFTRSVGWFTATFPITLKGADDPAKNIISVKESLRKVPVNGLSYGALRYFGEEEVKQNPPLLFNYLGRINTENDKGGSTWELLENGLRAKAGERSSMWEINAGIFDGSLRIDWRYAEAVFQKEEMEFLGKKYLTAIREVINFCLNEEEETFTPSDFSEVDLSQDDLANLLDQIDL